MFVVIDDRIINLDDISVIEPDAENNTIGLYYRGVEDVSTQIHYESTEQLIQGLQKFVEVTDAKEVPGTIESA